MKMKRISSVLLAMVTVIGTLSIADLKAEAYTVGGSDSYDAVKIEFSDGMTYVFGNDAENKDNGLSMGYYTFDIDEEASYTIKLKLTSGKGDMTDFWIYDKNMDRITGTSLHTSDKTASFSFNAKPGTYYLLAERYVGSPQDVKMTISKNSTEIPHLNKGQLSLDKGKSFKLKLVNAPSGKPVWVSGKTSVATVSKNGKVTAKEKGTAIIFCIIDNKAYKCKIKVK